MSDTWVDFKRAFGAVARRKAKAETLVGEIQVQEEMLRGLGLGDEATAMHDKIAPLTQKLQTAKDGGDTTQGYKDLGTVKEDARTVMREPVERASADGIKQAIPKLLEKIDQHLDYPNTRNKKLDARLKELQQTFNGFDETTPKDTLAKLESSALTLLDDVLKDSYGNNKNMKGEIPSYKGQAYKEMLKARYNINAESPLGPGLDKFYDALTLVPATHVAHTSLTKVLIFSDKDKEASLGDYAPMGKRIRVNLAKTKQHPTMEYQLDGSKSKVDTFKVTTLHEVGHAVDDKASVMANPVTGDFGGWNAGTLTIDDVARAYWTSIAAIVGQPHQAAVEAEIKKALGGQAYAKPPTVPDDAWKKAVAALTICKAIAADTKPWQTARPVNGICYFQDGGTWRSYSAASRTALTVRPYQWRSPAEWFAEIYAATWMMKKKPSGNVNRAAAIYMYRGE